MQESNAIESFLLWFTEVDFRPFYTEFEVSGGGVAGTCDTVGLLTDPNRKIWNRVYYIDWKSSLYVDRLSHGPQIAKYKDLDGRYPQAGIAVLHLSKDKVEYKFQDYSKKEDIYLKQFNLMRDLFFSRHPIIRGKAGL